MTHARILKMGADDGKTFVVFAEGRKPTRHDHDRRSLVVVEAAADYAKDHSDIVDT